MMTTTYFYRWQKVLFMQVSDFIHDGMLSENPITDKINDFCLYMYAHHHHRSASKHFLSLQSVMMWLWPSLSVTWHGNLTLEGYVVSLFNLHACSYM